MRTDVCEARGDAPAKPGRRHAKPALGLRSACMVGGASAHSISSVGERHFAPGPQRTRRKARTRRRKIPAQEKRQIARARTLRSRARVSAETRSATRRRGPARPKHTRVLPDEHAPCQPGPLTGHHHSTRIPPAAHADSPCCKHLAAHSKSLPELPCVARSMTQMNAACQDMFLALADALVNLDLDVK